MILGVLSARCLNNSIVAELSVIGSVIVWVNGRVHAHQFPARRAFMQLLKASALLPAVDKAACRSQSEASRLSVLVVVLRLSVGGGMVLVSLGCGGILLSTGSGV